jgi:hypothetical protein
MRARQRSNICWCLSHLAAFRSVVEIIHRLRPSNHFSKAKTCVLDLVCSEKPIVVLGYALTVAVDVERERNYMRDAPQIQSELTPRPSP